MTERFICEQFFVVNVLSVNVLSVNVLSVNVLSVNVLSVNVLSVNVLSVNVLSVNVLSWNRFLPVNRPCVCTSAAHCAGTMGWEDSTGTILPGQGSLYTLDSQQVVRRHKEKVGLSNGLGWTADNRTMFYVDSDLRKVYAFDFDLNAGQICTFGELSFQIICYFFKWRSLTRVLCCRFSLHLGLALLHGFC